MSKRAREQRRALERAADPCARAGKSSERSSLRKLDWASKHIEDLRFAEQAWFAKRAYVVVREDDPKTRRTVLRAKITEPPPLDFSLILGDAAHALRSALDHLALELAVSHHRPSSLPPAIEKASEFPILPYKVGNELGGNAFHRVEKKTGKPARGSGLHKLQGVHPSALEAIEGIQPYHRGTAYAEDPLWVIHELDRIDKHRRLNLTACAVGGVGIGGSEGYMGSVQMEKVGHSGPVEDGTPIVIMTVSPDSHFELNISKEIALAEPAIPQREFLVHMATTLCDYARDVVVPLVARWL